MFLATFFLFLSLITCPLAISWPRKFNHNALKTTTTTIDPVTEAEINSLLLGQDSLEHYTRRPDCFRKAAGVIRTHCGQLDMSEGERINAAISMTLCELATATHHSTPLECVSFSLDSVLYQQPPNPRLQGECVDALSRSAQFWSSYSGYLREVPQLCFAFRRWNDIDTARDIYKNATLEKAILLRFLISREKDTERFIRTWDSRLMEFQEAVLQLQSAFASFSTTSAQSHSRLETDTANTLVLFRDVHLRQTEDVSHLISKAEIGLQRISQEHARELSSHLSSLFVNHVDSIVARSLADNQASLSLTSQIQERWMDFGSEINSLSQSIFLLSSASSEAARIFNDSFRQAHLLQDVQRQASLSAVQLVDTMSRLTSTTHAELEKINSTAAFIRQILILQGHGPFQWLYATLMSALQFIMRVDPSSFGYMNNLPIYRITFAILSLFGYLLRATLSAIMTMSVAILSVRRYLLRYAESPLQAISQETPSLVSRSPSLPLSYAFKYQLNPSSLQSHRSHHHYRRSSGPRVSRIPDRLCTLTTLC